MGYYKNRGTSRSDARRYNAAARKAQRLKGEGNSRLIQIEMMSEVERYTMARDPERAVSYNKEVEEWQKRLTSELRTKVAVRSRRVAEELKPRSYRDEYGLINRLGFSFPRHGIWLHYGAGRGQGGWTGSSWTKLERVNGVEISTGIVRHTDPNSINGRMGTGNREAFEWFDPTVRSRIDELAEIVTKYFDNMIIDATRIYINKH